MKQINNIFLLLATVAFWYSCTTSQKISNQNLMALYKPSASILHPEFNLVNEKENTVLYYTIATGELLFNKEENGEFAASVKVSFQLKSGYEDKLIADSASKVIKITYNEKEKVHSGNIIIPNKTLQKGIIEVRLSDVKRRQEATQYLEYNRSNNNVRYNFKIYNNKNEQQFKYYFKTNDSISIKHNFSNASYYVRYYNRDFALPAPPFSIHAPVFFDFKPDSFYKHPAASNFIFNKKGIYHIQTDTGNTDGLTLFVFDSYFPYVNNGEALLTPLRYITSKNEYEKLSAYKNTKLGVDSFWIATAGNPERAKELIRKYYNRVQNSNMFFTSHMEGWKTDRGLIYLIYGAPGMVYRTGNAENWVYGEDNSVASLTFTFYKIENPFSANDYRLERNPIYKDYWYKIVDAWRQGRIYSEN